MKFFLGHGLAVTLTAGILTAQCGPLTTAVTGGSGQKGNMFVIRNISSAPVTITGFDQNFLAAGTSTVEIYSRCGTWQGFESNAAAWTLLGSAAGIVHGGQGSVVALPIAVDVLIPASADAAFYVTITNATATNVSYTVGQNQLNSVVGSDANLQHLVGIGLVYPFGANFGLPTAGRIWNGRINYLCGISPAAHVLYETNSPASSMDIDGLQGCPLAPAVTTKCFGAPATINLSSTNTGLGYEIGVGFMPLVPAGGGAAHSANGQLINLKVNDPNFLLLFNLALSPFPGNLSLPVAVPPIPTLTGQLLVIDPVHPDGFSLSQAVQLNGAGGSASVPGPSGDDVALMLTVANPPFCLAAGVPFYGTANTQMNVITNGRVTFGAANTSFTPTVAEAMMDPGLAGGWVDLNTSVAGNITITMAAPGVISVNYNGVGYFSQSGTASTFHVAFDTNTGNITLSGINTIGAQNPTGALNMFLGLSRGSGGTDPGQAGFLPAGAGTTSNGTDMLYVFGLAGGLVPGTTSITFMPNASSNYDWISL